MFTRQSLRQPAITVTLFFQNYLHNFLKSSSEDKLSTIELENWINNNTYPNMYIYVFHSLGENVANIIQ